MNFQNTGLDLQWILPFCHTMGQATGRDLLLQTLASHSWLISTALNPARALPRRAACSS